MPRLPLSPAVISKPRVPLVHRAADNTGQSRFNEETTEALRTTAQSPLANYKLVDATITTAGTKIAHNLGRTMQGWILVDRTDTGSIFRVGAPSGETEDATTHFWLEATIDEDVRVLVF